MPRLLIGTKLRGAGPTHFAIMDKRLDIEEVFALLSFLLGLCSGLVMDLRAATKALMLVARQAVRDQHRPRTV